MHAPELFPAAFNDHMKPYALRHSLSLNALLYDYCLEMMMSNATSSYEARILTLMDLLTSSDTQSQILIELMRRTAIPWSDSLDGKITSALQDTLSINYDELNEQYKLITLKRMILQYGINDFNVSDIDMAKRLVRYILFRCDKESAVSDALQCVNAYHHISKQEVIVLRCQNLILEGHIDKCYRLLEFGSELENLGTNQLLSESEQSGALNEILFWIAILLETPKLAISRDLIVCGLRLSNILLQKRPTDVNNARCVLFERSLSLLDDYQLSFSPQQVEDETLMARLFSEKVESQLSAGKSCMTAEVFRYGQILGFSREYLLGKMAELMAPHFKIPEIVAICKELDTRYPGEESATKLTVIAKAMISAQSSTVQESTSLSDMSSCIFNISKLAIYHANTLDVECTIN